MTSVTHCRTGKTADEGSSSTYIRLLSQVPLQLKLVYTIQKLVIIHTYNRRINNDNYRVC